MALVALSPQALSDSGIAPTYGALATGNTYTVVEQKPFFLHFKKSGANVCNVVFTENAVGGQRKSGSKTVAVPASTGDVMVGPFDPNVYVDKSNPGKVSFTVSEATGLTCAIIQLPLADQRKSA